MRSFEVVRPTVADALRPADYICHLVLAAGVAKVLPVPDTNTKFVIFAATGDFYAGYTSVTAALPSADNIDGTAPCELNPTTRFISSPTTTPLTLSLVAPAACVVTLSFYRD